MIRFVDKFAVGVTGHHNTQNAIEGHTVISGVNGDIFLSDERNSKDSGESHNYHAAFFFADFGIRFGVRRWNSNI